MEVNQQHNILFSCTGAHTRSHDAFLPEHSLWLIVSGEMDVFTDGTVETYGKGTLLLAKKNQLIKAVKKSGSDKPFMAISIVLDQASLKEYSVANNVTASNAYVGEPNVILSSDPFLTGYFDSLIPYFDRTGELTATLAKAKNTEIITLLLRNPVVRNLLFDFNKLGKIDLQTFMGRHFMYNVPLTEFAKLTGRSLSTFKRDFKRTFNESPERWLKKQRLAQAHYLITQENRHPADVYLAVGFENLSHFSQSFKEHFGYNPSQLRKQATAVSGTETALRLVNLEKNGPPVRLSVFG